ncbi:MAG: DUF3078 domain-containing protein [Ignavibacteria bacterium]|nr:DUF3078 domain-containing protein [Ignavibacteria bacterium]
MKIKTLLLLLFFVFNAAAFSQNKDTVYGWTKTGFIGMNLNQVSLSNWAAGGESSVSATGLFSGLVKYNSKKEFWLNNLDFAYGLIKSEDIKVRKNEDKIEFTSQYGKYAGGNFFYSALFNFRSQFSNGYNYPDDSTVISKFLAPGYLKAALGIDWKPVDYFSLFVSPATGRFTFVNDQVLADEGAYGVDPAVYDALGNKITSGKKMKGEFGASLTALFAKEIMENVTLASKLNLFDNYTDDEKANRLNVDVNWETALLMKINKFLTASISTNLIYDHNIPVPIYETINGVKTQTGTGPRTQFKEVLGIGFGIKF